MAVTGDSITYKQLKAAWDALDVEFGGKARTCPHCGTAFTSRFNRGQCPECRIVFYASKPSVGDDARAAIPDLDLPHALERPDVAPLDNLDWSDFEKKLYDLTILNLRRFATTHLGKSFYGFAFDCNSEYGNVLLCLNTETALHCQAEHYKAHVDATADQSIDEIKAKLRWNMGDWQYQGFNSPSFDAGWRVFETTVLNMCMDEDENEETFMTPTQDRFMVSACRVLIRLAISGAFDCVPRTPGFTVFAADHDEPESKSWDRLSRIRAELET